MVPHANWHHSAVRQSEHPSTVLTNKIVVAASVVYGEWRWQLFQNLLNSVLSPICLLVSLNVEVLVVVVVVGCVQGSWSEVSTFSCYSHCFPQFSRTCAIIQIKYVLPKLFVRIPGSHHPGTRLRLVPGFRDPGSVLILGQVTQYGNPYLICITLSSYMNSMTITPDCK